MNIEEGKTKYFYDNRAEEYVCKAHVLRILPHPEREDDRLIVYRWYVKHRQRWWYGVTTLSQQELWADYVQKAIHYRKHKGGGRRAVAVVGPVYRHGKEHGLKKNTD